jgi:hypothetical protein
MLPILALRRIRCKAVWRSLFIETEATPNPNSLKFKPGQQVLPENFGTGIYIQANDKVELLRSPLAKSLFEISAIKSLFFGRDFITVTKKDEPQYNWNTLRPEIFTTIFDFYATGKPIYSLNANEKQNVSDTAILETDDEVVASIKELLETRVRPSVQDDGGDIFYVGFDKASGIVKLKLAGACVGCASSSATLRGGVETMLKHYIPEVISSSRYHIIVIIIIVINILPSSVIYHHHIHYHSYNFKVTKYPTAKFNISSSSVLIIIIISTYYLVGDWHRGRDWVRCKSGRS